MRKLITAFLCVAMVFSLGMPAFAAELNPDEKSKGVDIGTTVPTNHIVTIVKDENSTIYYEGALLENGAKLSIARLSSPEFLIYSNGGFQLSKATLDTANVMNSINNGRFIIDSIHKDATLTVNSEKRDFIPQRKYTVVGRITQNDKPLVGADLKLCDEATFTTKDDGKFTFKDVDDGFHTLTALNNGKQVGFIAFEIRPSDTVKTIEVKKSDDGTYIINIGRDFSIVELNFDLKDDGIIDIPDSDVHENPKDITDLPQTGDKFPLIPIVLIAIASLAIIAVLIITIKFKNAKK